MKVLLITSIFSPDIGGPAIVAEKLATIFNEKGIKTEVLCTSDSFQKKDFPFVVTRISRERMKMVFYFVYLLKALQKIPFISIVYCLSGSPGVSLISLFLSKLFKKRFVMRPGGDFVWERATQNRETESSLRDYYRNKEFKRKKSFYFLSKFVFKRADLIIFPTVFLRDLYIDFYEVEKGSARIVDYPFPEIGNDFEKQFREPKEIIYAGRLIPFKNLDRLIEAFSEIKTNVRLRLIGEGTEKESLGAMIKDKGLPNVFIENPLEHEQLLEEIKKSYFVVIPSIFEPGSFLALECLKLKTPVLLTKESGLHDFFKGKVLFINPFDVKDIQEKIEFLLDENNWQEYYDKISQLNTNRDWEDFSKDHITIFQEK